MDIKHVLVVDKDLERSLMTIESCIKIRYASSGTVYDYLYHNISYDIVVLHREALGAGFFTLIKSIKNDFPGTRLFVTSSDGDIESYIELMCKGIYEYFMKPLNTSLFKKAISGALLNNHFYQLCNSSQRSSSNHYF